MKKLLFQIFLAVLFLFVPLTYSYSDTTVSGNVSGTWSLANSPYIVTDYVTVPTSLTLIIEPGVTVKFAYGSLTVNGALVARGTSTNKIRFTSSHNPASPGDWRQIAFSQYSLGTIYDANGNYSGGSILEHCIIEYAGRETTDNGVIDINVPIAYTDINFPLINHCSIANNHITGIAYSFDWVSPGYNPVLKVTNNTISNNSCSFIDHYTGGGIYIPKGATGTTMDIDILNNVISDNTAYSSGGGIYILHNAGNINILGNTITNNQAGGISPGGGISVSTVTGSINLDNNLISGNTATIGGGIAISILRSDASAAIINNNILNNSASDSAGAIYFNASSGATANISDNVIEENSAQYTTVAYLNLSGTETECNFINNIVKENDKSGSFSARSIYIREGNPNINNNDLFLNDTTYEIYNYNSAATPDIDASNNFWGTTNLAEIQARIYDYYDDSSRGIVDYSPIALNPFIPTPTPTTTPTPVPTATPTITPVPTPVPYNAQIISSSIPSQINAGETASITITMKNTGSYIWSRANAYRLGSTGSHFIWKNFQYGGYCTSPADARAYIQESIQINTDNEVTFSFDIEAPSSAGYFSFSCRMVRDGYTWFGDNYSREIQVIYPSPTPHTPTATVTATPTLIPTITPTPSIIPSPSIPPQSVPYFQSFEGPWNNGAPEFWINESGDWVQATCVIDGIHPPFEAADGEAFALLYSGLDWGPISNLISPPINFGNNQRNGMLTVCVYMYRGGWSEPAEMLTIDYRTSSEDYWHWIGTYSAGLNNIWHTYHIELPDPSSEYYLRFSGWLKGGNGIGIDCISITADPNPPTPSPTPTQYGYKTPTAIPTPSTTPSFTPTPTPTTSPFGYKTPTPSPSPTVTPPTPSPSITPTVTPPTPSPSITPTLAPTPSPLPCVVAWGQTLYGACDVPKPNTGFTAIAAGTFHSLGLKSDGSIIAWGSNNWGEGIVPNPNTEFISIAAGTYRSYGLKADGSIVIWGVSWWVLPNPNSAFISIAASGSKSLGLKSDGSIINLYTSLGDAPSPNTGFISIAEGGLHSLGLKSDGSIIAWGCNDYGECNVPTPNTGFTAIAAGTFHSLGLKSDGSIIAWGRNDYGVCDVPNPNTGFTAIAAGDYHNLGLKSDGSIIAWGANHRDQCNVPRPNTGFISIAAGADHSLGLRAEPRAILGDYNGDGISDLAIYRQSAGLWKIRNISNIYFGTSVDEPIPQDYDGDGTWDIAYFRPSSGLWKVKDLIQFYFGTATDNIIPADYDGDGTADPAYFRPSTTLWNVRNLTRIYFGTSTDEPIPADYDGDGTVDPTFFRDSNGLWKVRNLTTAYFGTSEDTLVPADYDGDGTVDFAYFRPSNGLWKVKDFTRIYFGTSDDVVIPGDYDGDGTTDYGYFRPSSILWKVKDVTRVYFGQSSDTQVTNPYTQ